MTTLDQALKKGIQMVGAAPSAAAAIDTSEKAAEQLSEALVVEAEDEEAPKVVALTGTGDGPGGSLMPHLKTYRVPKGQVKSSSPVKLANANRLLQPVTATSPGSIYFAVAISGSVRMAVRLKQTKPTVSASIRIEGYNDATKQQLKASGFFGSGGDGSFGDSYGSLHIDVPSMADLYKVLGAIYGVCCMHEIMSPLVNLDQLMETAA